MITNKKRPVQMTQRRAFDVPLVPSICMGRQRPLKCSPTWANANVNPQQEHSIWTRRAREAPGKTGRNPKTYFDAINTPITREFSDRNVTRCRALFQVAIDRASTNAAFINIAMCDRLKLSEQRSGVSA